MLALCRWPLLLLHVAIVVQSWNSNNQRPKRDIGTADVLSTVFSRENSLASVGASLILSKVILGNPKSSYAAAALVDVAPSMLRQRGTSMDSQAYQPGVKLKDVYYPSWWDIFLCIVFKMVAMEIRCIEAGRHTFFTSGSKADGKLPACLML